MYSNGHTAVPAEQSRSVAPETFLLGQDAQQGLPPEAVLALQQVDNRRRTTILNPAGLDRRFRLHTFISRLKILLVP
jgi:transcription factor STE12